MAYNVLKGAVEGSVDQHGDQEIGGIKVFKNTISASVFYDTDAESPCATMKDVAIKKIKGNINDGIIIADKQHGARTHHNLTYNSDSQTLDVKNINASTIAGSGIYLHTIPTDKFVSKINANFVDYGSGLQNVRGKLQVKLSQGLFMEEDSLSVAVANNSGLYFEDNKLTTDIAKVEKINLAGQNLSDDDLLLVSDISLGKTKSTTIRNLFDSYINMKIPHASGNKNEIQLKGRTGFESTAAFSFNTDSNSLNVEGKISSINTQIKNKLVCEGSVYKKIRTVKEENYEVQSDDYTILCDASNNKMNVNLPPPVNNQGRVLIFKKANSNQYKLNDNEITLSCKEGKIDIGNNELMKMNYSSRTLQCDGENWWIIGTKGS
tara:strand:+ start:14414 stop:15547 length:1134 start_codon:yes stop_codon:yes gene_type:complete